MNIKTPILTIDKLFEKMNPQDGTCPKWAKELAESYHSQFEDKWINVKTELPKKQGCYLVIAPQSFPKNCQMLVAEFYEDNNIFYSESGDYPMEDVTHWMPLPQPPSNPK